MQRVLVFGTCCLVAVIAFGTLGPARLPYAIFWKLAPWVGSPSITRFAAGERFVVFFILGMLLSFAFPNRIIIVCCALLFLTGFLEYLQTLTPDRHAHVKDVLEKLAGASLVPGIRAE
jgi:VanZ family protein